MENIIFTTCIMEKGDKPKAKDAKAKVKKPRAKKVQKQTQKQSQGVKQSVKIALAEKVKKPRKRNAPKAKIPTIRGTTTVSEIIRPLIIQQDTDRLAQVITPIRPATELPMNKPPAPKAPLLSVEQAPTTLDTELTAVSELVYPKARTPAFQEVQEPPPKRATKAKVKKTFTQSIGDFIKTNLLDQPADLQTQEAEEMPRTPLTIVAESPPVKPKRKGKTDVPISIQADPKVEQIEMGMEDVNIAVKPKQKRKGKTDVPISIVASKEVERQEMGMEDINIGSKKQTETEATEIVLLQDPDPISQEELNQSLRKMIVSDTIDDIIDTIETPVFSENPDFKTISQNVEIETASSSMLDYGDEGLTKLGEEGFVPVGNVRGMIEEIERKTGGRPRKYDTEEEAKAVKKEQTLESNRRARAEKKLGGLMERYIKQEKLNVEYGQFVSDQEAMDNLTDYLIQGREARRREEEQTSATDPFKSTSIYIAEEIPAGSDFLANEVGALTRLDNYGKVKIMSNDETDYQENPVLTTALFSTDAVDSNFPIADVEFL